MNVFELRERLIGDYKSYVQSFVSIRDERIRSYVEHSLDAGILWPEPLIQLNPAFEPGQWVDDLVEQQVLHPECSNVFRIKQSLEGNGQPLHLHKHQSDAVRVARSGSNYVLTTGTGSGKSLSYIVPIVDHVLRHGSGRGIQAIIVYPMNALANSQRLELEKFICNGYPEGHGPVTFARYTGQESDDERRDIIAHPPDILLTNYVMLELILTRPVERDLIRAARGLRFLVLDELHTYRGRQGADVSMLVRRTRDRLATGELQCIGTSATLAGVGSFDEQRGEVARAASRIFGASVTPDHVIGESLRRATPSRPPSDASFVDELRARLSAMPLVPPDDYQSFISDPISIWIESTFGVTPEPTSGRLIRCRPRSISGDTGGAKELSALTGVDQGTCSTAIEAYLLGGYRCTDPETGFPAFAFRLHQFISRGDTVYGSLETEDTRHITTEGQCYVPGDRKKSLFPLMFCRECGQEYYRVKIVRKSPLGRSTVEPRGADEQKEDENTDFGFIYVGSDDPWPSEPADQLERLPDEWIEEHNGSIRVRRSYQQYAPKPIRLDASGEDSSDGLVCHYIPAPFRFCLHCGVSYDSRQQSDFAKLSTLTSEGRSTATTILSLSTVRYLQEEGTLSPKARKLLSFTDNRQDASLQAGHFNDFVEIGLLRSALYRASASVGEAGLQHEELVQRVFDALDLPLHAYAVDAEVRYQALEETKRALRSVLGYRIYRDLKRGWRVNAPNLEQCGLLEIGYLSLEELCADEDVWRSFHPALAGASPQTRSRVARTLLDLMRRELAIKVNYLDQTYQEQIQQLSSQRLREPWALDDSELTSMQYSTTLFPRSRRDGDFRGNVFLSPRSGFGNYIRRRNTFPESSGIINLAETSDIIAQLLAALRIAGLVERVVQARNEGDVDGYQLTASSMLWVSGDGTRAYHDPIRVPRASDAGARTNPFFVDFYTRAAAGNLGLEAREHTAQVRYGDRVERENRFRDGRLPILFCSPTMELGVDISELNVVNMRNIPPTPANYAQRSGRAGRSGQPALVFSYCTTGSPHDQYFFKRPSDMVSGSVAPPRLDLGNEDLVEAHIHAVWLAETGESLGKSLKDVLNLANESERLPLLSSVADAVTDSMAKSRTRERARRILQSLRQDLEDASLFNDAWLDEVLLQVGSSFDRACDRWRGLYLSALHQARAQDRIIRDATRSHSDVEQAKRLRQEAESQLKLLTDVENIVQSDFYSYRYFASEGFLPGYSFPRLPLSAYIPARRLRRQNDEYVSRPRFLAISEFGPRAIVYHEGSKYVINKVILPISDPNEEHSLGLGRAKLCSLCGYLHPITSESNPDRCDRCGALLDLPMTQLFRLQNVSTKRRDRINSDEEERMRLGYEIVTGARFADQGGAVSSQSASVISGGSAIAKMTYGGRATVWRINLGWRRRANADQHGFILDVERGYWAKEPTEEDREDPLSPRVERVIPYVDDRRNCLLIEPEVAMPLGVMASLEAALKSAIQAEFQLEDNELAAESLPNRDDRRLILLYESAEGGAGVLRRLLEDPQALPRVARRALEICHFDPDGNDLKRGPHSREDCEAACYDCLMSYYNQLDHRLLDRQVIRDILLQLASSRVEASPVSMGRAELLEQLKRVAGSTLECEWLDHLNRLECRLPSRAQVLIESCSTRPDFIYDDHQVAVYIDGPVHDYPERQERDRLQAEDMADLGYIVVRFGYRDNWDQILSQYTHIFGGRL